MAAIFVSPWLGALLLVSAVVLLDDCGGGGTMIIPTTAQAEHINQLPRPPHPSAPREPEPFTDEALSGVRQRAHERLEAAKLSMADRYILRGYNPVAHTGAANDVTPCPPSSPAMARRPCTGYPVRTTRPADPHGIRRTRGAALLRHHRKRCRGYSDP